ncbi:hypothetical protein ABIA16_001777 [Sinorhizobium fredii]
MDEELIAGALEMGAQKLEALQEKVGNLRLEAATHGRSGGSREVLVLKAAIIEGFGEVCLSAAKYVAAASPQHHTEKAPALVEALNRLEEQFVEYAADELDPGNGRLRSHYEELAGDWRQKIEAKKARTIKDFEIFGIVGGEHPMSSGINVHATHQSQVNINSPGAKQRSEGNQIIEDNRAIAMLRDEIRTLQTRVRQCALSEEAKLEILDHLEPLQTEAERDAPDKGKLARLGKYLTQKADEHGWQIAENVTQAAVLVALGLSA